MARKKQDTTPEQEVLDAPAKVAEYSAVDAGLAELRTKVETTAYDVTTTEGDKTARALRAECVSLRTSIEAKRVEAKKPLLEQGKLLDAEAKRITAEIVSIESPIDAAIRAEEKRKADAKAAKDRAEAEARLKIDQAIAEIAFIPVYATGKTAAEIQALGVELAGREMTADEFGERIPEAGLARGAALEKLRALHAAAVHAECVKQEQEAEAERIRKAKADLEQQQRELADQRAKLRQDAIGETLDAGTKATMAPLPEPEFAMRAVTISREEAERIFPPPADEHEAAERQHMGNALTGTGIYSGRRAQHATLDAADAADTAPDAEALTDVIANFYDVPPFTARAWLVAAFAEADHGSF